MLAEPNLIADLTEFAEEFGRLLRSIESAASARGIGAAEGRVLRLLYGERKSPAEVGRALVMNSAQVSRLLKSLEAKQLASRTPISSRRTSITLTPPGRVEADAVRARQLEAGQKVWSELGAQSRERFLASITQMDKHLDALGAVPVIIRQAELGDTGVLLRGAVRTFVGPTYGYSAKLEGALLHRLANVFMTQHVVLVAERQRALVGGLAFTVKAGNAAIDYFAVFMGEQGNGYGSQLLAEAELRARDLGLKRLTIDFPASRFGGSFFEGREGWVRQGVRPKQFGGLEGNWEVWWRNLVDTR